MTYFHWNMDFKKNKNDDRIAYDTLLNRTQPNNVQHGYLWFKDWLCNRNHENKPSSSLTTSVLTMFSNAWNSLAFLCQLCSDDALICIIIFVLTGDIPGLFQIDIFSSETLKMLKYSVCHSFNFDHYRVSAKSGKCQGIHFIP